MGAKVANNTLAFPANINYAVINIIKKVPGGDFLSLFFLKTILPVDSDEQSASAPPHS
jgi:hypothetical protein